MAWRAARLWRQGTRLSAPVRCRAEIYTHEASRIVTFGRQPGLRSTEIRPARSSSLSARDFALRPTPSASDSELASRTVLHFTAPSSRRRATRRARALPDRLADLRPEVPPVGRIVGAVEDRYDRQAPQVLLDFDQAQTFQCSEGTRLGPCADIQVLDLTIAESHGLGFHGSR